MLAGYSRRTAQARTPRFRGEGGKGPLRARGAWEEDRERGERRALRVRQTRLQRPSFN